MTKYVHVPRKLILDQSLGNKRALVYAALGFSSWPEISVDSFVSFTGYSGNRNAGKAKSIITDLVYSLKYGGYFSDESGKVLFTPSDHGYGIVYYSDYQAILNMKKNHCNTKPVNQANMILLLSHIRCNMRSIAGYPEYYSDLIQRIAENTGISSRSIMNSLENLESLGIIHSEGLPRYQDDLGHWHTNVRIFVNMRKPDNDTYDWQRDLLRGKRIILDSQHN